MKKWVFIFLLIWGSLSAAPIQVGVDVLKAQDFKPLKKKRIGLVTNQTAVNASLESTAEILKKQTAHFRLVALFAPEHGYYGRDYASQTVSQDVDKDGIPIYSLHGATRRPTKDMLKGIDILVYDIQDIGSRSYTFITTLFYVMEEAAKANIGVIVLDRPNPINGITIDGPMLEASLRSMVGYINVPYCHGMTIGELAVYFNKEYEIGCKLQVIPMKGWSRSMTFDDTGLPWIPTSPHIPESDSPLYYPITGILGEVGVVSTGIGYTLPFKLIGAPWIDAQILTEALNQAHYPGVYFSPFYYRPFYGKFKNENCQGALITVHNPLIYKPIAIQFLIISTLKKLYPVQFKEGLEKNSSRQKMFSQVIGTPKAWDLMKNQKFPLMALRSLDLNERKAFEEKRKTYLFPEYAGGIKDKN